MTSLSNPAKEFLTLAEAAEISRRSIVTLRRAITARRLAALKPGGKYGKTFVRPVDLTRYMESNRIVAIGEMH